MGDSTEKNLKSYRNSELKWSPRYNRDNQRKLQYLCGMCGLSVL